MADTVVVTGETRVDVVTVTGCGTSSTVKVTGDVKIDVLTVGTQGPPGASLVLAPATKTTLGGIIVGDNLSINANGLLSAQAVELANITRSVTTLPRSGINNGPRSVGFAGETATVANTTSYDGFILSNSIVSGRIQGQLANVSGGSYIHSEITATATGGVFMSSVKYGRDSTGLVISRDYYSQFGIGPSGINFTTYDSDGRDAGLIVRPTYTQISGGTGDMELSGASVTINGDSVYLYNYTPSTDLTQYSLLNMGMCDQRYQKLTRAN